LRNLLNEITSFTTMKIRYKYYNNNENYHKGEVLNFVDSMVTDGAITCEAYHSVVYLRL
jgi:hypothetical protein